jgi:glyoxylase-like metal-dependent hydrolase (beta-lactamase superfamily II)
MAERHFGPIWFIPGENKGKYPYCHSVYIEGAGILIDPASDRKRLAELKEGPGVKAVWLSHYHEDHFLHLDLFEDLPFYISQADAKNLLDLENFMDAYGIDLESRSYWRPFFIDQFHFRSRRAAGFLRGGTRLSLGPVTVDLIATPGHTPGHLAFFFREESVLFMVDYDLTKFGPWYGDVLSSIEETLSSLERIKEIPAKVWLTGHEDGVFEKGPGAAWEAYRKVIDRREEALLDFVRTPRSLQEIVDAWIVYGKPREPKVFFELGEIGIMKKHLERLMRQGRVIADGEKYLAV